jgi:DNA-directed RNA polymerase specialized sigma24 family protein
MLRFQPKPESRPTFEDSFFEHHARLNEWAMQLTNRDRPAAEDLVQELYVRFAGLGPIGEHVENPEDYIFSVLRNLHYARIRRARTSAIDDLSIVDYDSAQRSLRAVDRNGILFVHEELHRVCHFLCERKSSSRSASIFILRYFLGYYPGEVMKVVQSTRRAVDKAILVARSEAQLHLEAPQVFRPSGTGKEAKASNAADSQGLFRSLHAQIFASCKGKCFAHSSLASRYKQTAHAFTTGEIAHLVSCPKCLDWANRLLNLPLLAERSPDDAIGRDTPQDPDDTNATGGTPTLVASRPKRKSQDSERLRKRMRRCLEEVQSHRPQRLSIAVDGDIRASHSVTAPLSELRVELRSMEKPGFIEVLSEQDVCLGFVPVETLQPEGGLKQIALSDGRALTIRVSFTSESPTIQVVYSDPVFAEDELGESEASRSSVANFVEGPAAPAPWIVDQVRSFGSFSSWLQRLTPLNMNPLLTSAVLLLVGSLLCFLLWTKSVPQISAGAMLNRAERADASVLSDGRTGVIYQRVKISAAGHSTDHAIYRDPQKKRRPKQQQLDSDAQRLKHKLDLAGANWDEPLSAADYQEWRDRLPSKRDAVTRTGANLLTLTTSSDAAGPVLQESLTVRESDFHAVQRTIEFRDAGSVEIAELNFDVMPWGAVNQDWFEPLAEQTGKSTPAIHGAIRLPRSLSEFDLNVAEIAARTTLNQLHADSGEQINLSRGTAGVDVKGVVDTNARKRELAARLALIPHVHVSLLSVEEIGTRSSPRSTFVDGQAIVVHHVEAQPSPLEQYLREKNLPIEQLETISRNLLDQALRIQQAQMHLTELQPRFAEANQLPAEQQEALATLSKNYSNAIRNALEANRQTLLSIGLDAAEQVTSPSSSGTDGIAIDLRARNYQDLCQQLITSGTSEPKPASMIAGELGIAGRLISSSVSMHTYP